MVSLPQLLEICPNGAWITEDQAVEALGLGSKAELKTKFNEGSLPNVIAEHGARVKCPAPYNSHAFFFVQPEGRTGNSPHVSLEEWVKVCQGDPTDPSMTEIISKYTGTSDDAVSTFNKLKSASAISTWLSPGNAGSGDYRYGTSGGNKPSGVDADGEIYTKPDGTRVRRVKRASSASATATANSLQGFLGSGSNHGGPRRSKGSQSVAGEGEIYVRADGKKVRRVKRSVSSAGGSVAGGDSSGKNLDGFLSGKGSRPKVGGSASVAGDMIAVNKESSLTGEVYVRADGKKVRRVKKSISSAGLDDNVEIITRPDGTKVKRSRKPKGDSDEAPKRSASTSAAPDGLSGFLEGSSSGQPKSKFRGSHSVAGDQRLEGEVYVRSDGKKVRRVRKVGSGSASVSGVPESSGGDSSKNDVEVYTRPDGTKVMRVKKPTSASRPKSESSIESPRSPSKSPKKSPRSSSQSPRKESKTLEGFLGGKSSTRSKVGGSASVAGDRIAVSKDESLTGEVYIRADGKKVRRVKKSAVKSDDNVEIITRPDGTKVRRIRKTKPKDGEEDTNGLSGFLDSQPKTAPKGGAATVGGEMLQTSAKDIEKEERELTKEEKAKKNLDNFLNTMDSRPQQKRVGGSASVAGDMIAVNKESSLTGEVYVRADGKKVRRVKKSSTSSVQPGDEVEIITRPDGTKVRRIKRAKKPADSQGSEGSLQGFLGEPKAAQKGSSAASVTGDMLHSQDAHGEIYIRADGKKVRRVRKSASSAAGSNEQYEIYVRPDGKKVRRIRKVKATAGGESSTSSIPESPATIPESAPLSSQSAVDVTKAIEPSEPGSRASALSASDEEVAAGYRKMLKMGMPDGAVLQKMGTDGVAQHIQDSVIARETSSGVMTAQTQLAESSSSTPASKFAALSPEEEQVAAGYRKMLKMGMPEGAVGQKMAVDGIAQNIQDSVLAHEDPPTTPAVPPVKTSPSLSAEDEEIAAGYRKMLKMGMPEGAVGQKMAVDGVAQHIQDSVLARDEAASTAAPAHAPTAPATAVPILSAEEEEIAAGYKRMLKMGMPEGAVGQKMAVDGVAQNIQDSVLGNEVPVTTSPADAVVTTSSAVPAGMALVAKDHATVADGMVLVPQEQAARTEGMVAVPRDQVGGDEIPEGYVLVPKDQVKGDPGKDDLILVKRDQVKSGASVVLISEADATGLKTNDQLGENDKAAIHGANIVDFDDLPSQVEMLKQGGEGKKQRFLVQALPDNPDLEQDFIRKNLLPKGAAASAAATSPAPAPAPPKKPEEPSSSITELLAEMSKKGGDFDAAKMAELLQKLESAEKRQKKLEKQLEQAGVAIAEDIDYDICLKKVAEIGKRMGEIGGSDVTHPDKEEQNRLREEYFKLEQEMEKYNNALMMTDEYQAEQDRLEKKWEEDNAPGNLDALKKLRRHMPIEVRNMSEAQLTTEPTPNGKYLPKATAKKFKRTNVLQLVRRNPDDIVRMHPSTLENMRVTGLTLTERRALYEHLRGVGPQWKAMKAEKMTERKWTWYNMMKGNFKENLASWQRHVDQYGPPGNHPYATRENPNTGCPLIGKQCPLKADKLIDYDGDYGFTEQAKYEVSDVKKADAEDPGAKAMQEALALAKEKKANERSDALKKHYKNKLLQVSKANGSCEQMDDMIDKMEFGMMKWIDDIISLGDDKSKLTEDVKKKEVANFTDVLNDCKLAILDFCGRSGMQLSGKRGGEDKPDPRSLVECSLAEEAADAFDIFTKFVNNRLKQTGVLDTRIKSTIDMLKGLLTELRERNAKTISNLGAERLPQSRKLKTPDEIEKDLKEKRAAQAAEESGATEEASGGGPPLPGPPRGGLMDAIKAGRGGGGRGGLLDAIKSGGRGGGGGRGGLLDAIKSGGRGRGGGGGRGGLLDAIKGRGRGGGPPGGGRGGLLDAIKGRGRGGGGGPPGGGRGGLLAAIQARGGGD